MRLSLLLLFLTGCTLFSPKPAPSHPPPLPVESGKIFTSGVGPWFDIGKNYTMTVTLVGTPQEFLGNANMGNLEIIASGLSESKIIPTTAIPLSTTFPILFSASGQGMISVALRAGGFVTLAQPVPYVAANSKTDLIITDDSKHYVVTPNPQRIPLAFAVYFNSNEQGYFTVQDQILLPHTSGTLTIVRLDDSDSETDERIVRQIP